MTEITIKVDAENLKRKLDDFDLCCLDPMVLEDYIREHIKVKMVKDTVCIDMDIDDERFSYYQYDNGHESIRDLYNGCEYDIDEVCSILNRFDKELKKKKCEKEFWKRLAEGTFVEVPHGIRCKK